MTLTLMLDVKAMFQNLRRELSSLIVTACQRWVEGVAKSHNLQDSVEYRVRMIQYGR